MIEDRPPLESTGAVDGRKPDPLLSPGRQILMEEEVITPPRGGRPTVENQGLPPRGGGRPAPEPQGSPRGVRAVPKFCTEGRSRDSGLDRQKDIGSPVDILVDTVARMQQDLTRLREENRLLRTPAIPQVVQAPRRAAFTSIKVPRFVGITCIAAICGHSAHALDYFSTSHLSHESIPVFGKTFRRIAET